LLLIPIFYPNFEKKKMSVAEQVNSITKKIADKVQQDGISCYDLAAKLHVTYQHVKGVLRGSYRPGVDFLCDLAKAVGVEDQIKIG
jgi:ribosome-binding protein aMBF1 (putative translation factor)